MDAWKIQGLVRFSSLCGGCSGTGPPGMADAMPPAKRSSRRPRWRARSAWGLPRFKGSGDFLGAPAVAASVAHGVRETSRHAIGPPDSRCQKRTRRRFRGPLVVTSGPHGRCYDERYHRSDGQPGEQRPHDAISCRHGRSPCAAGTRPPRPQAATRVRGLRARLKDSGARP